MSFDHDPIWTCASAMGEMVDELSMGGAGDGGPV